MSGQTNWMRVLRWWWSRPKSLGMTALVLLVAGVLWVLENRGALTPDVETRSAGSPTTGAEREDDRGPSPSLETLVASTQTGGSRAEGSQSGTNGGTQNGGTSPSKAADSSNPRATTGGSGRRESASGSSRTDRRNPGSSGQATTGERPSQTRRDASPQTSPRPSASQTTASSGSAAKLEQTPRKKPLGVLELVSGKTYRTTAGLIYTPGSADGHRLKHVAKHFRDNPDRPIHGVFDGTEQENFAAIDEAFLIGVTEPRRASIKEEDGRTVYEVDLKRRVGYIGGQSGARDNHPEATGVRLVVEGERVITAFPVRIRRRR